MDTTRTLIKPEALFVNLYTKRKVPQLREVEGTANSKQLQNRSFIFKSGHNTHTQPKKQMSGPLQAAKCQGH